MNRRVGDVAVAVLAVAVLAYGLLVVAEVFAAFAAAAGLTAAYAAWRAGEAEHAAVLAALWTVLVAALWVGDLRVVGVALVATAVAYAGWDAVRGRGRLAG